MKRFRGPGLCCEVNWLEVSVRDGDPPQLHYLWVGDAPSVVAAGDGLVIADVKAGPWNTQGCVTL